MLMKLENEVTNITPIDLPDKAACEPLKTPVIGAEVQMAGHGGYQIDANGHALPGKATDLKCATMHVSNCNVPVIQKCKPNEPVVNWICYAEQNVDTCGGDSGGGLIHKDKLYGVHVGSGTCVCTIPAFALNVCHYREWIENNAK
ncbi:snake venom serine protease PTLE1-like [Stegastes partitus]|uniref:Snake venom serine protease PTLE1-like n=1 Tax=Stegastes partitus TaxID=144197 RepID=A0A9Y4MZB7_9TELE|nr:PREDICTED: snake venom serine protease PTLE1-like [Stegastes partitus]